MSLAAQPSKLSIHPLKFLYTTYFLTTLPLRVLGIFLYYLPKSTRSKRTYKQAVATRLVHVWFKFATAVEYRTPKSLEPGADKKIFVLMDPAEIDGAYYYTGVLTNNPTIRPEPIAGFWYGDKTPPKAGDTPPPLVALHFHGGAFVFGGARPNEGGWGPAVMSKHMDCPVLLPQYRLSNSQKDFCFPAALQDAVTAYTYLLRILNVRPENIVLSGDSAGGNLVVALLRYIEEGKSIHPLPLPRAALLWGPWVNLDAPEKQIVDRHRNAPTDYISSALGVWGVRSYTPPGWPSGHPYISPLKNEFYVKVPIFLHTSSAEILHDSHTLFAKNMKEQGCKVEVVEMANAPHDTFAGGEFLGFGKETEDAIKQAALFVKEANEYHDSGSS